MQSEVETLHLLSVGNPDTHDCLEHHEDNEGSDSAIDNRREDAPDLDPHLGKVTLKQTRGAADREPAAQEEMNLLGRALAWVSLGATAFVCAPAAAHD